jgi:K+-transporting ATPase ATPase B chain
MHLANPYSAILSVVIFNAIIISLLIPPALRGVKYGPMPAEKLLIYNLLVYRLGGMVAPFIGIKIIDIVISVLMYV